MGLQLFSSLVIQLYIAPFQFVFLFFVGLTFDALDDKKTMRPPSVVRQSIHPITTTLIFTSGPVRA